MFTFLPRVPRAKHLVFLVFIMLMALVALAPDSFLQQLEYLYGTKVSYRWFFAHFIHLGFNHLLMNIVGATLLWLLVVAYVPARLLFILLCVLPLAVSWGLAYSDLASQSVSYRGFSGILYGFYAVGVFYGWRHDRFTSGALGLLLIAKLFMEQQPDFNAGYLSHYIAGMVAVDAHLWGALAGLSVLAFYQVAHVLSVWRLRQAGRVE